MLVVWQTVALALVAGWLLNRGLRGTRVGDEPRCRKCDYRLDGLTSQQCPECGTGISERTVVHGTRVVRRRFVIAAALMVFLWVPVQNILWLLPQSEIFAYAPDSICLRLAKYNNLNAVRELTRRIDRDQVDRSTIDRLFNVALSKIRTQTVDPVWHDLLFRLFQDRQLRPTQLSALCPFVPRLTAAYRPQIRQGDPLVVYYEAPDEKPQTAERWPVEDVWIDDRRGKIGGAFFPSRHRIPMQMQHHFLRHGVAVMETRDWQPGTRNIEFAVNTGGTSLVPLVPERASLSISVEILPASAPSVVNWSNCELRDDELKSKINVAVKDMLFHPEFGSRFSLSVDLKEALDVPVAWDVIMEVDGQECDGFELGVDSNYRNTGRLPVWNCGEKGEWQLYEKFDVNNASEVFVVLRASQHVALSHPDIQEIWKGELRFGPFPWSPRSAFQHGLNNMNP